MERMALIEQKIEKGAWVGKQKDQERKRKRQEKNKEGEKQRMKERRKRKKRKEKKREEPQMLHSFKDHRGRSELVLSL